MTIFHEFQLYKFYYLCLLKRKKLFLTETERSLLQTDTEKNSDAKLCRSFKYGYYQSCRQKQANYLFARLVLNIKYNIEMRILPICYIHRVIQNSRVLQKSRRNL